MSNTNKIRCKRIHIGWAVKIWVGGALERVFSSRAETGPSGRHQNVSAGHSMLDVGTPGCREEQSYDACIVGAVIILI